LILRGEYTFIRLQKRYVSALALLIPYWRGTEAQRGGSFPPRHTSDFKSEPGCMLHLSLGGYLNTTVVCLNHKPHLSSTFRCFRFLPSLTLRATLSDIDIDSCPKYGRSLSEDSEVLHANALQPQPVGLRSQYGACLSSFVYFYERKAKVQIVHHAPVSSRAPGDREFINVLLPVIPIADVLPPVLP